MSADPNKLKLLKEHKRREVLFRLALADDERQIFVGSSSTHVLALDALADEVSVKEYQGHDSYVTGVVFAGDQLVSASYDGRLIWWDVHEGKPRREVDAHTRWIRHLDATADGKYLISVADDMTARIWNAETGQLKHELKGHAAKTPQHFPSMLYCGAFSFDGKLVATGDRVGKVSVWETESGRRLAELEVPEMYTWDPKQRIHSIGGVRSLAFSPDAKSLAVGGMGQVGNIDHLGGKARVHVFDWSQGKRTHEFESGTYKGLVECLSFEPQGKWLIAAGGDNGGFIQFFDLAANKLIKHEKAPMHVHDIALTADGTRIFAVGHEKLVVWGLQG